MIINDRIYGDIHIKKKVIIDIIKTPIFQRLKKINQGGATPYIQPIRNATRYEHSIGVWYLFSLYKRSIEGQVASLLHDLSHTAFSHVMDFVVDHPKHEYADEKLNDMIKNSEIPEIIKKNDLDLEKILDKSKFHLLDNNLPDISTDRLDYFMRDGFMMGSIPQFLIYEFLDGIYEKNNILYFKDLRLASNYAILFVNCSRLIWHDPTSHGSYFLLAKAIKLALADKLITEEDFFTDDETMMNKLKKSNNTEIKSLLKRLSPGNELIYTDEKDAEFYGSNKPRFVDPYVEIDNGLQRVSNLVPSLKYYFEEFTLRYKNIGVKKIS